ncbi:MAG TPA: hypothetical protein VGI78_25500 [Acetobacteraceae bacterium]
MSNKVHYAKAVDDWCDTADRLAAAVIADSNADMADKIAVWANQAGSGIDFEGSAAQSADILADADPAWTGAACAMLRSGVYAALN